MPHLLVTGGGRRLGLYIVKHFLQQDWKVSVLSRHASGELTEIDNDNLQILAVGDYQPENVRDALIPLQSGTVDMIVHNASAFEKDETDPARVPAQLARLMAVHVTLPTLINTLLKEALIRSDNASIVHMTDIYTLNPNEAYSHYCASKAALENMSLSFAKKLAPDVRVNSIQPGALMFLPEHDDDAKSQVLEQSLLKIESGFQPVIQTIEYLRSNHFVTGTAIRVDGGRAICR